MQIIERYLESVKSCLPKPQADDIIKELSENISSQIEDREGELGRNLTETEVEGILKQHGHPLVVASRYRQEQRSVSFGRQIIGPALFPFYLRVLKFNLGLTAVILVVIFAALFAGGQPIGNFPQVFTYQMLIQFAIVTLIFWLMDKHFTRFPDRWDPRKRYGVRHPAISGSQDDERIPRVRSISQFVGLSVALVWLRLVQHAPVLIFGPAAAFLALSPAWSSLYVPFVVLLLIGLLHAGINVVRPDWMRFHFAMRIVTGIGGIVLCYLLIRSGNLIVADAGASADAHKVAQIVNQVIYYSVLFAAVLALINLIKDARRLLAATNGNSFSNVPSAPKP